MFNYALLQKRRQKMYSKKSRIDFFMNPLWESLKTREELLMSSLEKRLDLHLDRFLDFLTPFLSSRGERVEEYNHISSFMLLHWVGDVKAHLSELYTGLKPQGSFQGCFVGGSSLLDIRNFFMMTELELYGKVYPRFSPLIEGPSLIKLLNQAGFCDIVVDTEIYELEYSDYDTMMSDLCCSGETNCLQTGVHYMTKEMYQTLKNKFNQQPMLVSFEILYWSCFKK